jgi:hypothetical protein
VVDDVTAVNTGSVELADSANSSLRNLEAIPQLLLTLLIALPANPQPIISRKV